MKIVRTTLLICIIAILTACAGRQFVRPSEDFLQLGKTTENQIVGEMGVPLKTESFIKRPSKEKVKQFAYLYSASRVAGAFARGAYFYFIDGVMVGHRFFSDFPGESTDFDLTKVQNIVENKSTRRDVETLLGKPTGEAIYPFTDEPESRVLLYHFYGSMEIKEADFEIDKDGIVRHFSVKYNLKKSK